MLSMIICLKLYFYELDFGRKCGEFSSQCKDVATVSLKFIVHQCGYSPLASHKNTIIRIYNTQVIHKIKVILKKSAHL